MNRSRDLYLAWSRDPYFDETIRAELAAIVGDQKAIEDRFYKDLEFGTGGLRGVIGAGTNRMNRYTVRQAAYGLGAYIQRFGDEARQRGVVIAYDNRRCSPEFAREAALMLNALGVRAYLWPELRPTPMLSFAVRELAAIAGIVITASHNPPAYNGYKVYWEDGGQMPPDRSAAIAVCMAGVADITTLEPLPEEEARAQGLLMPVEPEVDRAYLDRLLGLVTTTPAQRAACRILYTPLHGTGLMPVRQALTEAGYRVRVVAAQAEPDPDFATVRTPNPEEPDVYALALAEAAHEQPDVILATDPDADRLGVMARDGATYRLLSGNEIGALLVDYLLASRVARGDLPENGAVVKSIATSNLVAGLCAERGVTLLQTHIGFKFIGDLIREFEETGRHTFLFGFEESYGYLGAPFVRDKDAVMAALLVAEAAAWHKAAGGTLIDALARLWRQYGHFREEQHNVHLPGKDGQHQIAGLMDRLRSHPPAAFGPVPVAFADDYLVGAGRETASGQTYPLALGRANVLHYRFADGGFVMVRPSGTEPKLKVYVSVLGGDAAAAEALLQAVKAAAVACVGLDVRA
ncbi:MAG TPA: phospho-sugar mutase [Symbiobacteriaceae bacterium]